MYVIKHMLIIRTPPEEVYLALTTPNGLRGWWTVDVQTDDKLHVGSIIHFRFGNAFASDMSVEALKHNQLVKWKGLDVPPAWLNSEFSFELVGDPLGTKLRFTQVYAEGAPLSEDDYGSFTYNWGWYLRSLKDLCEKGAGAPFGSAGNP